MPPTQSTERTAPCMASCKERGRRVIPDMVPARCCFPRKTRQGRSTPVTCDAKRIQPAAGERHMALPTAPIKNAGPEVEHRQARRKHSFSDKPPCACREPTSRAPTGYPENRLRSRMHAPSPPMRKMRFAAGASRRASAAKRGSEEKSDIKKRKGNADGSTLTAQSEIPSRIHSA